MSTFNIVDDSEEARVKPEVEIGNYPWEQNVSAKRNEAPVRLDASQRSKCQSLALLEQDVQSQNQETEVTRKVWMSSLAERSPLRKGNGAMTTRK